MTREQAIAVEEYRNVRAAYVAASDKADAAFRRFFTKLQAGERTNAAQATRLEYAASYLSADLSSAQSALYRLDLDPNAIDDADGVERTCIL